MLIILIWVGILLAALSVYFHRLYSSFERNGVKHFKPLPLIGNMGGLMMRKRHFTTDVLTLYRAFPEERFVGSYEFMSQVVLVRDLELVKKIAIKDFEFFLDHRNKFEGSDSFWTKSLIFMKGQEWKDMRSTLSPAFTSSKIRLMVPFMVEVGDQMIANLKQKIEASNGYLDIDCKDLASRYATDVIATCAFGLKANTFADDKNEFHTMGKEITGFNFSKLIRVLVISNFPRLAKLINIDFMSQESIEFFKTLILKAIEDRTLNQIIRPDMVHLLMEAKKGKLTHDAASLDDKSTGFASVEESAVHTKKVNRDWSDSDLVAQAVLFFIAGFDTVSTTMSFLLHELAINPEAQEKLAQEIKEYDVQNGGKFDYKSIQSMLYLDQVVSEALRMWPPGPALERLCNTDYNLGKPNKNATKDYIIRKGTAVIIPAQAFHLNPDYFPNPNKFDPERFSAENQKKIQPSTYLPFGLGPRNCIGSRFALCEVKVMTYQILRHLEVSPCEKTCIPAELDPKSFSIKLKGGHWLRFKTRA